MKLAIFFLFFCSGTLAVGRIGETFAETEKRLGKAQRIDAPISEVLITAHGWRGNIVTVVFRAGKASREFHWGISKDQVETLLRKEQGGEFKQVRQSDPNVIRYSNGGGLRAKYRKDFNVLSVSDGRTEEFTDRIMAQYQKREPVKWIDPIALFSEDDSHH
jgi:hypothetical protein